MRKESDVLGELFIEDDVYYGLQTARAALYFAVSDARVHPELIRAIALIKKVAAQTNMEIGDLDPVIGHAIVQAAEEVMSGRWDDQFPISGIQGGAGTSTNANVNEVIANRALEILGLPKGSYDRIHPNDHVNLHQSTNDVYSTAMRLAALQLLEELSWRFAELQEALQEKEREFAHIIKLGRTQLQDAVPITLGQEFGAYAQAIARDRWRLYKVGERLRQVSLGGTAVGTGINAPLKYIYLVNEKLRMEFPFGLARNENLVDGIQNMDVFVEVSGLLKAAAVNLAKISNDLRLLASGPRGGIGEIRLPELQAGSTIMPGKVNPVIPELINQVSIKVIANDLAITLAAEGGQLELNAFSPTIAHCLLESMKLLRKAVDIFINYCIKGVEANEERCRELVEKSTVYATVLTPYLGYDTCSELALESIRRGISFRHLVLEKGLMTEETLDKLLEVERLTRPG
ncbi:MAG: aspartate ammonia-lyase [Syntrophothermus sp.]|uniref:aspartate ammonia-lyase n=1 Tax=Syntrophothermus sp. TaxID=2736299 RepID=UPI00257C761A|nr:aspartate ammonia-lyase [Syntrophothermus sp.]NSW84005.1 aspartate ammonia-lyase [Syntrophothermus sp.]